MDYATIADGLSPQIQHMTTTMSTGLPYLIGAGALHSVWTIIFGGDRHDQPSGGFPVRILVVVALTLVAGVGGVPNLSAVGQDVPHGSMSSSATSPSFLEMLPGRSYSPPSFNLASAVTGGVYANALDYSTLNGGRR